MSYSFRVMVALALDPKVADILCLATIDKLCDLHENVFLYAPVLLVLKCELCFSHMIVVRASLSECGVIRKYKMQSRFIFMKHLVYCSLPVVRMVLAMCFDSQLFFQV